jgi:hypothetical protein
LFQEGRSVSAKQDTLRELAWKLLSVDIVDELVGNSDFAKLSLSDNPSFAAADSSYSFVGVPPLTSFRDFLTWARTTNCAHLFLKFSAQLFDVGVRLSVAVHLDLGVLSISTAENMLWNFSENREDARKERLDAFFALCEQVCDVLPPKNAAIGSEPCHADEISVNCSNSERKHDFVRDDFFSENHRRELYAWYVNVYSRRWENARRI